MEQAPRPRYPQSPHGQAAIAARIGCSPIRAAGLPLHGMHSHRADALPQDGVHYHFTAKPQMEKEIADGQFLEHAHVHGNIYGTSVAAVREVAANGKCCILDIDVQGARQVRATAAAGSQTR